MCQIWISEMRKGPGASAQMLENVGSIGSSGGTASASSVQQFL